MPEFFPTVGEVRPSQLMFSFGVGAGIDLPHLSVMVLGLNFWNEADLQGFQITEERLLAAVRGKLGAQVERLYVAPADTSEKQPGVRKTGVPVTSFPHWLRCPKCNRLASISSGLFKLKTDIARPERSRYIHENCSKFTSPTVVPARFLVACPAGHMDDFPWDNFVHRGGACEKGTPTFTLFETGVSGEASGVQVKCESCGKSRSMADAFGRESDVAKQCTGRHPHLHLHGEECEEKQRAILLGASNSWFPVVFSTFSVPAEDNVLAQLVEEEWATLQNANSLETLKAFRAIGQLQAFTEYNDETLFTAICAKRENTESADDISMGNDLKLPEWEALSHPDQAKNSRDFQLKTTAPPSGFEEWFEETVLVERLREVHALVGFTRIDSPNDWGDVTDLPAERITPLTQGAPTWLPASEVRGEGIFLRLRENKLLDWLSQHAKMDEDFFLAHTAWRARRNVVMPEAGYPHLRYILLHSLSHALMRQICLECGYGAAGIRERIYAREAQDHGGPMAGILIYTSAPDSQGTLGGLVSIGQPNVLGRHLRAALGAMEICASDPLCAEHHPTSDGDSLHGAACHACLFSPETACERGNRYLDRSALVQTLGKWRYPFFTFSEGA